VTKAPGTTQIVFSLGEDMPTEQFIAIRATRPLPSSSNGKRSRFVTIKKQYIMVEQNISLNNDYIKVFGELPQAGSIIYIDAFTWRHGWERSQFLTTWKIEY
jgi:hypothetical protein